MILEAEMLGSQSNLQRLVL